MRGSVLIVEDEKALRMTLSDRLLADGYTVELAGDGDEGVRKATRDKFDLIILDIMLPRRNGFDVCRDLRHAGLTMPILMLTARGQVADKVVGLKLGADDYLTKPFDMMELTARIEALLRRGPQHAGANGVQQIGDLRLDFRGTQVSRGGKPVNLSAREFQLLRYLVEHRGETLSRDTILKDVWGYSAETFTRTVDVHIATLRQKLERDPKSPEFILTVQGMGYKFAS